MRHLSPKSLASGRGTEITWLCRTETRSRVVPQAQTRVGGRRPSAVAAPAAATPELSDRPRRRTFTVQDKLQILAEIDQARAGSTGAILRREDPERLARVARRWRARRPDAGQARAEVRPAGGGTGAGQTGECAAGAQAGARRDDHLDPKKVAALLGLPLASSDNDDAS